MAALASIATVIGAGASLYGNVRQAQQAAATGRAQAQVAQRQEVARQQELLAQREEAALARRQSLSRSIATARARQAAGGLRADDGSAAALTAGMASDSAAMQGADDATFRARLAAGRASLLQPDDTLGAVLRSGRTLGFAARSLLD